MELLTGKFEHDRNENLDKYYQTVGVPFVIRKVLMSSKPTLEFSKTDDKWEIATKSSFNTSKVSFRLDEEYDDPFPGLVMKSVTTLKDNNQLIIVSIRPDGVKLIRTYQFSETELILILFDEKSGVEAKRFFKRVS